MNKTSSEFFLALSQNHSRFELNKENDLFGQFVGVWEFDWFGYETEGLERHEKGEWIFTWILEGRAIQDVWICPSRQRRRMKGTPKGEYGTTIRFYNPSKQCWDVVWVGPMKERMNTFEARMINNEIIMEETNNTDYKMKWIFSEIKADSFVWKSIICENGSDEWKLMQKMIVTRKNDEK